jgi:hypothetical protein
MMRETKREIKMMNIPNSIPVKTRLPLSAWAAAAMISFFCVVSSMLHLSPVDNQSNARVEQTNLHADQARILSKQMMAAATSLIATIR